jgi:hypothetical protein
VQFITDPLHVTGNGKARTFEDARDYALIRVPLKGARAEEEGRRTRDFGTRLSFAETAS